MQIGGVLHDPQHFSAFLSTNRVWLSSFVSFWVSWTSFKSNNQIIKSKHEGPTINLPFLRVILIELKRGVKAGSEWLGMSKLTKRVSDRGKCDISPVESIKTFGSVYRQSWIIDKTTQHLAIHTWFGAWWSTSRSSRPALPCSRRRFFKRKMALNSSGIV